MHQPHVPDPAPAARDSLSSAYLAQLLDAVEQAVIATNPRGEIVFWNRCAERLYGWRADEVLGRDVVEVVPSEMSREQAADYARRKSQHEWLRPSGLRPTKLGPYRASCRRVPWPSPCTSPFRLARE